MIEFHDPGVVVYTEKAVHGGLGWRNAPTVDGRRVSVDGDEAARLCQALGLTFDAMSLYGDEFDLLSQRPARIDTATLQPSKESIAGTTRILELWARMEGPQLLHVHVTVGTGEDDEFVQELTYAGSYTVWWSAAAE